MLQFGSELQRLVSGPISWFADWPDRSVPTTGCAVYTIWDREQRFLYAGMSGRSPTAATNAKGPFGRLNSHASGRRSGDQFCIYVCDRIVLPGLHNRISEIASAALSLDAETRALIRQQLGFRLTPMAMPGAAFALEKLLRHGGTEAGLPFLNPHKP
jgi:hypothetical protein